MQVAQVWLVRWLQVLQHSGTDEKVDMSELAKTGGIINAYEAIKYASNMKTVPVKTTVPKSPIKKERKN